MEFLCSELQADAPNIMLSEVIMKMLLVLIKKTEFISVITQHAIMLTGIISVSITN